MTWALIQQEISLNRLGLILNFIGCVLIAFSVGRPSSSGSRIEPNRRVYMVAITRAWAIYSGLTILGAGFILSFLATWMD